jgi:DNA polymerase III subunit beta
MQTTVEQSHLSSALGLAQTVAPVRRIKPILANVFLQAEGEHLRCSATDLIVSLTEQIPATVTTGGSITVNARDFNGIIRNLPGGSCSLKGDANHNLELSAPSARFNLVGMSEADFPSLPDPKSVDFSTVPAHLLSDLIQKTTFSVSDDEARVNLNGALLQSDGSHASTVSTDGHRLTYFKLPFAGPKLKKDVIIPRKGMVEIRKVLERVSGDVDVGFSKDHVFVRSEALLLSVKLNDVAFPPYAQVIPKAHTRVVLVDREHLLANLRLAQQLAPERASTVKLDISEEEMVLTADNPDKGVAELKLPVSLEGEPLVTGFNASYLTEAVEACDTEQVRMEFQGELDPCVVRPSEGPELLAVVMPMRI